MVLPVAIGSLIGAYTVAKLDDAPAFAFSRVRRIGADLLIEAQPRARGARS